jgi:hypothetical protein
MEISFVACGDSTREAVFFQCSEGQPRMFPHQSLGDSARFGAGADGSAALDVCTYGTIWRMLGDMMLSKSNNGAVAFVGYLLLVIGYQ